MRRNQTTLILIGFLFCLLSEAPSATEPLKVVTEEMYPLNYRDSSDGKLKGLSVEIAKTMLSASGQLVPIQLLPWRRAYRMALSRENTLIFSLVRSPERESLFHWIGPVHSLNGYLIALSTRDDIQLKTLDDANRYQIATISDYYTEDYLLNRGIKRDKLESVPQGVQAIKMLLSGRVDLIALSDVNFSQNIRKLGLKPELNFKKKFKFKSENVKLYLALSKRTPDHLVKQFRAMYRQLEASGEFDRIYRKYNLNTVSAQ